MKRIFLTMLAFLLVLTSCSSNDDDSKPQELEGGISIEIPFPGTDNFPNKEQIKGMLVGEWDEVYYVSEEWQPQFKTKILFNPDGSFVDAYLQSGTYEVRYNLDDGLYYLRLKYIDSDAPNQTPYTIRVVKIIEFNENLAKVLFNNSSRVLNYLKR